MIFRTMKLLEHASACSSPECKSKGCQKVKKLHAHARSCTLKLSGNCPLCKHMWCLLNLHAKQCVKTECQVPRCMCATGPPVASSAGLLCLAAWRITQIECMIVCSWCDAGMYRGC